MNETSTQDKMYYSIMSALEVVLEHGWIDGEHHKQWVIAQMVRKLCETEVSYAQWAKHFEQITGVEFDEGIAP